MVLEDIVTQITTVSAINKLIKATQKVNYEQISITKRKSIKGK